jgi:bacterioferritin-associated ferredoxin
VLICHCRRVSSAEVDGLLEAGATKVGQVVRATRAGSDCGACIPLLRERCASHTATCPVHPDEALAV